MISGQKPRFREELKVLLKVVLHSKKVLCEQIFPCHRLHTWKVVCSLIRLHFHKQSWDDGPIDEPYVPILFTIVDRRSKIAFLSNLVYYFVLCVQDVENEGRSVAVLGLRLRGRNRLHRTVFNCDQLRYIGAHWFNCCSHLKVVSRLLVGQDVFFRAYARQRALLTTFASIDADLHWQFIL